MKKTKQEVQAVLELDALKIAAAVFAVEKELRKILYSQDYNRDDLDGIKELWTLYFALTAASDKASAALEKV